MTLRGAAKTATESATQIHPTSWTLADPFAKKWDRRRMEQYPPKFSKSSLSVSICIQSPTIRIHEACSSRTNAVATYPGLFRSISNVESNVDGLYDASNRVDRDEQESVGLGLEGCIVQPKHGAEQRNHVRNRFKPFSRLPPAYPPKGWPAKGDKISPKLIFVSVHGVRELKLTLGPKRPRWI